MDQEISVTNNLENQQFEIFIEDDKAELVYRFQDETMYFLHTKVPISMRGKGIASRLVLTALNYAKDNGHKIAVLCPFTAAYVRRNPDWYDLYDTNYHKTPFYRDR